MKPKPTVERLHELLTLDPATGVLRWRVSRGGSLPGEEAGHATKEGYITVRIDYVSYGRHVLVWTMTRGAWPAHEIDHEDRVPGHDWFSNLRSATKMQQQGNRRGSSKRGLPKGVSMTKGGRFVGQIAVNYTNRYLGVFDTPDEAHVAYMAAAREHFGEFACDGRVVA